MPRLQKIAATVSAAALLGAGGLGVAQAATTTTTTDSASTSRSARPGPKGPGGPMAAAQRAAIAKTLGVTNAQLKAALDAARPAKATGERPDRGAAHKAEHTARETAMYAAVAKELDLSADAVQAAFEANRPAKRAAPSS